ncbi:MAG: FHA domain-containing protein [Desulfobulbaceae bacterium]|nr:FHA domain-containing protein [Desulfobulbaceae bacterium]
MEEWVLLLNGRIIKRFTISEGDTLTIGRGQDADITVDNNAISRQHSSLELKGGVYYLTDLYSLNGTKVNGEKIDSSVPIKKTDQIGIGKFTLKPAEFITTEEEVGSSCSSLDGMDQTLFIDSRAKKKPAADQDILKVVAGSAKPPALSLSGIDSVKIGKDASCDVVISGLFVAKTQFFITKNGNGFNVTPNPGWRKVFVNGDKIKEEVKLNKGDVIKVAGTSLRLD